MGFVFFGMAAAEAVPRRMCGIAAGILRTPQKAFGGAGSALAGSSECSDVVRSEPPVSRVVRQPCATPRANQPPDREAAQPARRGSSAFVPVKHGGGSQGDAHLPILTADLNRLRLLGRGRDYPSTVIMNDDASAPVLADVTLGARFGIAKPQIVGLMAG